MLEGTSGFSQDGRCRKGAQTKEKSNVPPSVTRRGWAKLRAAGRVLALVNHGRRSSVVQPSTFMQDGAALESQGLSSLTLPPPSARRVGVRVEKPTLNAVAALRVRLAPSIERRDADACLAAARAAAPVLMRGLSDESARRVAHELELCSYARGELIFKQGDSPDGYYFIVAGEVSVYKRVEGRNDPDGQTRAPTVDHTDHELYGKRLCMLRRMQGFGELSFVLGGGKPRRTASVVSEGDDELRAMREGTRAASCDRENDEQGVTTSTKRYDDGEDSSANKPTLCIRVPAHLYMLEMQLNDADNGARSGGGELRQKLSQLESCLLFRHWPIQHLYEIAAMLRLRSFAAGTALARFGSEANEVYILISGELAVNVTVPLPAIDRAAGAPKGDADHKPCVSTVFAKRKGAAGERYVTVELALLRGGVSDVFGVCEALDAHAAAVQRARRAANLRKLGVTGRVRDGVNSAPADREDIGGITTGTVKLEPAAAGAVAPGAWRRSAICVTGCEVLTMSSSAFQTHVLARNKVTAELAGRLGVRRARWESLRVECALHLARNSDNGANEGIAPPRITRRTMAFARYALSPEMLAPNVAKVNHRTADLANSAREARSLCCAAREVIRRTHEQAASEWTASERHGARNFIPSEAVVPRAVAAALGELRAALAACCRVAECGAKLEDALGGVPLGSMSRKLVDEARDGRAEMQEIVNQIAPVKTCSDMSAQMHSAHASHGSAVLRQRRTAGVWGNGVGLKGEAARAATKAA